MQSSHDPYLNTVRRTLTEERIKKRQDKIKNASTKPKKFLSQNIILSDYIYLPKELEKLFLLSIFILVPYIFGIITMLVFMGYEKLKKFLAFDFDLFMLSWTVGYEVLTLMLLILIIKSAFSFKKK